MALPIQVRTAFGRGLDRAAKVVASKQGWQAWVWVRPVMYAGETCGEALEHWARTREGYGYDPSVYYYTVRRIELSDWHLDQRWELDLDLAIAERPVPDEWVTAWNEDELVAVLERLGCVVENLREPNSVDYPYPPGRCPEPEPNG